MSPITISDFQSKTGILVRDIGDQKGKVDPSDRFYKVSNEDGLQDVSYQEAIKAYHDPRPNRPTMPSTVPDSHVDAIIANANTARHWDTVDKILTRFFQKHIHSLSADQTVRMLERVHYTDSHEKLLAHYVTQNVGQLSVAECLRVAQQARHWDTLDQVLLDFTAGNSERITLEDLRSLSHAAHSVSTKESILLQTISGDAG